MRSSRLSFENWVKKYKPLKNPFDSRAACDGFLFDKFGDSRALVKECDPRTIWSLTITDGRRTSHWEIGNGFSIVNLHGYMVTAVPWGPNEFIAVRY